MTEKHLEKKSIHLTLFFIIAKARIFSAAKKKEKGGEKGSKICITSFGHTSLCGLLFWFVLDSLALMVF